MIDLEKVRKDTPHCQDKIFLNSAGSSLMPIAVQERMMAYLEEEAAEGGYRLYDIYEEEINEFYKETARMLNCQPRNIAFAYNATDAFAQAVFSIPFKKGDVVVTSDDDYVSNHVQFYMLYKRFGVQTIRVNNLTDGSLDLVHLERLIREHRPRLVSITHVPTNTGKVQNVEAVGKMCQEHDVLYIVDACQSVGQMPVDVSRIQCDFLAVTGRKFLRGPRGTGFIFVSDKALAMGLTPLRLDGWSAQWTAPHKFDFHQTAKRFEIYEKSYSCLLGLKEAIRYANDLGLEHIYAYNQSLLSRLRTNLEAYEDVELYDWGNELVNIFTFRKRGVSMSRMSGALQEHRVYFSIASKASALIDFKKKGVDSAVRLSPHYFNTIEEIDTVCDLIARI